MIYINKELCDLCGACLAVCPENCMDLFPEKLSIVEENCTLCCICVPSCPVAALSIQKEYHENG